VGGFSLFIECLELFLPLLAADWMALDVNHPFPRGSGRESRHLSFEPCCSQQTSQELAANFPDVTKATALIRATLYDPDAASAPDDLESDAKM